MPEGALEGGAGAEGVGRGGDATLGGGGVRQRGGESDISSSLSSLRRSSISHIEVSSDLTVETTEEGDTGAGDLPG